MSAIFGIISKHGKPVEEPGVAAMKNILQHRAVDGKGYYQTPQVFLGHHKFIANINQKQERQPVEDDYYVIVADARIDNRAELIKLLEITLSGVSDAYIILQAYHKWKQDCTNHLEGEFVFVILNKGNNTIFSATDHIGFRSYFYYDSSDYFIFSSELRGITAFDFVPKEYEQKILIERFSHNVTNITPYKNIFMLFGGRILWLNDRKELLTRKYWNLEPTGKYNFKSDSDWPECLRELMFEAVRNMINTDKPVGVQLSGGLDSSFVAAVTAKILKEQNKQLITVSSVLPPGYKGTGIDERFYIEKLCDFLGNVEPHYVSLPEGVDLFTDVMKTLEETSSFSANGAQINQRYIFEKARQYGVNVFLTGLGGDITISNTGKTVVFEKIKRLELAGAMKLMTHKRKNGIGIKRILMKDILMNIPVAAKRVDKRVDKNMFVSTEIRKLIEKDTPPNFSTYKGWFFNGINNGSLGKSLPSQQNYASHFTIHYNHPIYEKNLMEFYADLPPEQNILNGIERSLIKRAMAGLTPSEIYNRNDKKKFLPDVDDRFKLGLPVIKNLLLTDGTTLRKAGILVDEILNAIDEFEVNPKTSTSTHTRAVMMSTFLLYYCYKCFFDNDIF